MVSLPNPVKKLLSSGALVLWCSGALVFWFSPSQAASSSVEVEVRAIPDQAKIGDEIRLYVQAQRPRKYSVLAPSRQTALEPFEIKKIERLPHTGDKNRVCDTFVITLTVFTLGDLEIPSFPVRYQDGSGHANRVMTEAVRVKIFSVGKKAGEKDKMRPIKGPVSVGLLGVWSGMAAGIIAVLSIFLAIKVFLRLRRIFVDPESLKPPHERVLLELGRLKKKRLVEQDKVKEHYSELSDILRRYLERQFGILALEQTTVEVLKVVKEKNFEPSVVAKIQDVLEKTDLVKFARFIPARNLADDWVKAVTEIVAVTRPVSGTKK
jgi:hypothetical protein